MKFDNLVVNLLPLWFLSKYPRQHLDIVCVILNFKQRILPQFLTFLIRHLSTVSDGGMDTSGIEYKCFCITILLRVG